MGSDGQSGSGEYSAMLMAAITEMREDQRDFRTRVEGKLDDQASEIQKVRVQLADGTGRMNLMQQSIDSVQKTGNENAEKLRSLEAGSSSGAHKATETRGLPKGGWIPADKLPVIIASIGTLIASVIASVALMRNPTAPAPTPTQAATTHP